uniref:Novel STAND NTPase 5 domain-containing protein n=1 Tax=Streptomyces sp. NBC_00049 TaxID=2903617 RepID=A0AAU2K329_9ACTN
METSTQTLLSRLVKGPTMLLLGQEAARPGSLPATAAAVADRSGDDAAGAYRKHDRKVDSEPAPEWLADIAEYPWNGVFTSRIDTSLARVFSCGWRRLAPTAQAGLGRHPRSATELQLRYLFGGVGLPEEERPPVDVIGEVQARGRAAETLNTLADSLITPRGVLVIEGYEPGDWLAPQELFLFVSRLQPGQAHLFAASDDLLADPFIRAAVEAGRLLTHVDRFSTVLAELEAAGRFQRSTAGRITEGQRVIPVGDSFADVDVDTWNRVIGAARPIDTELLEPFASASSAMTFQRFRTFLGAGEGSPPWKAVASGFNLRRDFEDLLHRRVGEALGELSMPKPIVVAGQTATGKSIALCALALEVARSGQAAVLHRSRRGDRPTLAGIDAFAAWADESHGIPTLLVWDGMVDIDEYYTLQRQLRSRGRRVLIVGSSYLPPAGNRNIIRVDPQLSDLEVGRVKQWLTTYGIEPPNDLGPARDSSFLALLYRAIPDTERGLRRGLTMEMRWAEMGLEKLSKEISKSDKERLGSLAHALLDAGFSLDALTPSDRPHAELIDLSFKERSATEQLTSLVLVAGRRGLLLPLALPLRILGGEGSSRIVELAKRFDIFRWEEDESGGQYLGTRTRLEAELLAREDLNVRTEVEAAGEMIENLRPMRTRPGGEEVQFIVDLMDAMGPQSQEPLRYAEHYLDLATAFGRLRASLGQTHHRLALLEANLTREHVLWAQGKGRSSPTERIELLRSVQRLLEVTIEEADASPRARLNLLVELASTDGAQVYETVRLGGQVDAATISGLMGEVTRTVLAARVFDPENFYPVDVIGWATLQAVQSGTLTDESRMDLLANEQASLDSIDPESLTPRQLARYGQRRVELSQMLGDAAMEAKHLAALSENGDPAAHYFLAREAARSGPEGAQLAVESLLNAPIEVRADWRCSRLLLDLFWQLKTGKRFLSGERNTLAFTETDWNECLRIADAVPTAGDFDRYRLEFLRGISLFHLRSYLSSAEAFRRLDQHSQNLSSRVVSTYLYSDAGGTAQSFTGSVRWATADGRRGTAWVDQLSIEVPFIPQRFSVSDFRAKGDILPSFHIAFNMRGALADPIRAVHRVERPAPDGQ